MGDDGFSSSLHVVDHSPFGHVGGHGPAARPDSPPSRPAAVAALEALVAFAAAGDLDVQLEVPARRDGSWPADWPLPSAWVRAPDGSAVGVSSFRDDSAGGDETETEDDEALRVTDAAHECVVESMPGLGRSTAWPSCPDHPDTHPLQLTAGDDTDPRLRWSCPRTDRVVSTLGADRP